MSNIIVMAFSPRNIVGCLPKKRLTRGGHGHPRTPPRYALENGCFDLESNPGYDCIGLASSRCVIGHFEKYHNTL